MNIKNWKWHAKQAWRKGLRLKRRFVSWVSVFAAQDLRLVIAIVVAIKIAELI